MPPLPPTADDPQWYKDAVVYEVHVRAFGDSNRDGIGDFDGLTSRLDYVRSLGVTALWLLPFYPSPLRDDGYDIADYGGINPAYGDLRAFRRFLKAAHQRGLRVITELVLNHTSDQHEWFQRSRRDKPGGRWRRYYVWSDTPDRYHQARVIFEDFETSNWTWDPIAGAYYWHRFFHHQPDLNYDNPEVAEAMLRVVDKWLAMGVDGVRLDAVPYLFERDGTNCENLPETHAYLKGLRAHVDERFPGRMLLAEANQWPEDAVAYFGDAAAGGDECHMAFHFPVMPRVYMAVRMEDREPLIDILQQTPPIPSTSQWAMFLRNHDELTLEMVTDEERDYMYRAYAADPQMRVNLGIRRRLAPLLGNDRRKIELMNALLLSLPGTPVIYYGDELGMGDNVYLGDRDAVRTPMQWSSGKNAGFSDGNPQKLYLPVIIDPDYHYESINVETQERNASSLLWWTRRIIALRQQHPVFGRGRLEFLFPENAKVLAFLREDDDDAVLVVANLSRFAQSVTLDLHHHRGAVPVELFGGTEFPAVGEGPYSLTLGPYGFYWFALERHRQESRFADVDGDLPTLRVDRHWQDLFAGRVPPALTAALPRFFLRNRWYAGRQRKLRGVEVTEAIPLRRGRGGAEAYFLLLLADYADGEPDTYVVPVTVVEGEVAEQVLVDHPGAPLAWVQPAQGERRLLCDAMAVPEFSSATLDAFARRRVFRSERTGAELRAWTTTEARRELNELDPVELSAVVPYLEQSNSSIIFGSRLVVKMFRRAQQGINPDLELGRHLTDAGFAHTAPLRGALEYTGDDGEPRTIAIMNAYVANEGDAWRYTLDALSLFYEQAMTSADGHGEVVPGWGDLVGFALGDAHPGDHLAAAIGPYLDAAELLGRRVAQLHATLATGDGEDFAPAPFSTLWQRSLYQAMRGKIRPTLALVRRVLPALDGAAADDAARVLDLAPELDARFAALTDHLVDCSRIRVHGDLHLGQVLHAGRDFVIIDFEGEPSRSPTERRIKRAALSDVAGMLRSFQYAVHAGLVAYHERGLVLDSDADDIAQRGHAWLMWVSTRFLAGYLDEAAGEPFVPDAADDVSLLLDAYLLDKALYEVRYDLSYRPEWAQIPLRGVVGLLDGEG